LSALLAVELRRAFSRRFVHVLAAMALAIIVVAGFGVFLSAETEAPAAKARSELLETCQYESDVARCQAEVPTVSEIESGDIFVVSDDPRFELTELWPDEPGSFDIGILPTTTLLGFFLAIVVGASLIGAEYRAGTIETLLVWEPRRLRVVAAKLLSTAVVALLLYLTFQTLLALALLPTAVFRGVTEGADAAWLGHLVVSLLRIGAIVAALAVVGGSFAVITRNTGGAIALVFAYLIGVEVMVQSLSDGLNRWFVVPNLVLATGLIPVDFELTRSAAAATVLLLGYLATLVAVTAGLFRTRDLG